MSKNLRHEKLIFFVITLSLQFSSCINTDDDTSITSSNNNTIKPPSGNWKVIYFRDNDKEETSKFSDHSFEFQGNGTLVATDNGATFNGAWSKNSSGTRFKISITGTDALDEMTYDWLLDEMTNNSIKLRDDNEEHSEELHLNLQ